MTDLMYKAEIQEMVRDVFRDAVVDGRPEHLLCLYSDGELASLPAAAVAWSFGIGNPVASADLQPSGTVVDLGSGGGIDAIFAARAFGPTDTSSASTWSPIWSSRPRPTQWRRDLPTPSSSRVRSRRSRCRTSPWTQ